MREHNKQVGVFLLLISGFFIGRKCRGCETSSVWFYSFLSIAVRTREREGDRTNYTFERKIRKACIILWWGFFFWDISASLQKNKRTMMIVFEFFLSYMERKVSWECKLKHIPSLQVPVE